MTVAVAQQRSVGEEERMKLRSTVLTLACVAAISARGATPSERQEEEEIRTARTRQNVAIVQGRVDEVASYWTDDVTICRGLGTQMAGKAAYRKLFEEDSSLAERIVYQREPTSIEASPVWPLAFETGTWTGHRGDANGPIVISGRYSAQWVKRDGKWLIRSEVFVALEGEGIGRDFKAVP
jgi:ketosteroid isomerase-like protein